MVKNPDTFARRCNWTCVIGSSGFHEGRYGIVWDFDNVVDGFIRPQQWDQPIEPWLDADYFSSEIPDHPDQEILAMLRRLFFYKA